jgi:hypothetical protein
MADPVGTWRTPDSPIPVAIARGVWTVETVPQHYSLWVGPKPSNTIEFSIFQTELSF